MGVSFKTQHDKTRMRYKVEFLLNARMSFTTITYIENGFLIDLYKLKRDGGGFGRHFNE